MRSDIKPFTIGHTATIRDAITQIEANATGLVLLLDQDGTLRGTASDGDIRRGLLQGKSLDLPVETVINDTPIIVSPSTSEEEILSIFRKKHIQLVPVVSDSDQVLGVHLLKDHLHQLGVAKDESFPAVIMAGGLGSRLRPLTENKPKPLVEIGGKPILERIIDHLALAGAENLIITTRYLAEQIEGYFGTGANWDIDIAYLREKDRLGTGGSLRRLKGKITRSFLVMNADILTNFNVRQMFRFHEEQDALMTVGVRHYSMQVPYGVVKVDGTSITGLSEKPVFDFFVNTGIYIISPQALDYIFETGYFDITELIENLLQDNRTVANFPIIEQWMDIGRPEDVEKANAALQALSTS